MVTFHKLVPEKDENLNGHALDPKDIVIKYRYPLPNGTFVWAGLSAMMDSNALWNEMTSSLARGQHGVVLGISYHQTESLSHLENMPTAMYFSSGEGSLIKKQERRPVPSTYEVTLLNLYSVPSRYLLLLHSSISSGWCILS